MNKVKKLEKEADVLRKLLENKEEYIKKVQQDKLEDFQKECEHDIVLIANEYDGEGAKVVRICLLCGKELDSLNYLNITNVIDTRGYKSLSFFDSTQIYSKIKSKYDAINAEYSKLSSKEISNLIIKLLELREEKHNKVVEATIPTK